MPIYEYLCQNCKNRSEILQGINEPPAKACPVCHQEALKRLISAAGFQLKGTGWYQTDYRDSGKKPPSPPKEAGKPDAKTESGSTETASETQATKKSETKKETSEGS